MEKLCIPKYTVLVLLAFIFMSCEEGIDSEKLKEGLQEVAGTKVDLRDEQTPLKNQAGRRTCITFAACAALEAAYKREGYGTLDLSEEFMNYMGKVFWLHPQWDEVVAKGEDASETSTALYAGGGGVGFLEFLAESDFKIPKETNMPYRTSGYPESEYPEAQYAWDDDYWRLQKRRSNFNLDPRNLTDSVLKADNYYDIQYFRVLDPANPAKGAKNPELIENALKEHKEVVWDFRVASNWGGPDNIWRPCADGTNSCVSGAHSMLIVGFDKTAEDSSKHHFIVKNSWGPSHASTQDDGYTFISYDYVRKYGYNAGYIESIHEPGPWEELDFVGRWKMSHDGWNGTLDIYHVPGIRNYHFDNVGNGYDDWRVGSYYDADGNAYKVNGYMQGNKLTFWLDFDKHNIPWDVFNEGKEFVFYQSTAFDENLMAGFYTNPNGRSYTGYARKVGNGGYLRSGADIGSDLSDPNNYLGEWDIVVGDETKGDITLSQTTTGSGTQRTGIYEEEGSSEQKQVTWELVPNAETHSNIELRVIFSTGNYIDLYGKHLSWKDGFISGYAVPNPRDDRQPFYMIKQETVVIRK